MGELQLQLMLRQLESQGVNTAGLKEFLSARMGPGGPSHATYPGVPNELGIVEPPAPPRTPSIGPARPSGWTSGSSYPSYPNEMGMVIEPPAKRGPSIGPAPRSMNIGATMMAGQYPVEMGMVKPGAPQPPMDVQKLLWGADGDPMSNPSNPSVAKPSLPTGGALPALDVPDMNMPMKSAKPAHAPRPAPSAGGKELPFQTFQRLTGQQWSGGKSQAIQDMMNQLGVTGRAGSAEANLALQRALLQNAGNIQE
jgi:hypothetical protein